VGRGAAAPGGVMHLVILDNEAVQALRDLAHPKHRQAVSQAQVIAGRKRRAAAIEIAVPTAVRAEAGWDRTSPAWAFPNRLRIADLPLGTAAANTAAAIRTRTGVSVADAHIGAAIQSAPADQITVISSDPGDIRRIAGDRKITITTI
jgi:predicted nucleic acid-binding protein